MSAWLDHGAGYFLKFVTAMTLLYGLAFLIGLRLRQYLSQERVARVLGRNGPFGGVLATLFGAATPFCSCTTVPIFAGMVESNVRLSHALSFLIASPTVNPPALALLVAVFGWRAAAWYLLAVFAVALIGGSIVGQRRLSGYVHEVFLLDEEPARLRFGELLLAYARFLRRFIVVILIAGTVATVLHGWIPSPATLELIGRAGWFGVPVAVGLGALVYADVILLIPIADSLLQAGVPAGSVVAFTMAASGLGIPALLLLSRVVYRRLLAAYVGAVLLLLVLVGYVFNAVT